MEAGRLLPPPESAVAGPAVSVSLGDACDLDPELLAAVCGPDGLGGEAALAAFGEGRAADVLRPGPVLAALTAQAVTRVVPGPAPQAGAPKGIAVPGPRPAPLSDDELAGVLQAARRLANLAAWQQTVAIAEFARRRQAEFEAAKARGVPVGCRDGEFPGEELAVELVATGAHPSGRIDTAVELTARLPLTLAAMEHGLIDLDRACAIAARTSSMSDADAAYADAVLAAAAPGLRLDQLARKAEALEKKLAPETVLARRELAKQLSQRVEARREESGNACLAGRELDSADVIASKAYIDALAARLRSSGLFGGPVGRLRALVLTDLTQGRNPLDRLAARPAPGSVPPSGSPGASGNPRDRRENSACAAPGTLPGTGGDPLACRDDAEDELSSGPWPGQAAGGPVALPALVNLLVPAGTLLGWGTAPAQAGGWGLLDADETQALVRAASQHPRTRCCMTIIAPDGTAIAHGCAAGRHPWPTDSPPPPSPPGNSPSPRPRPDPPPRHASDAPDGRGAAPGPQPAAQAAQLLGLLRRLNITLEPVARDTCDHAHAEDHYVPSRKLRHLIHARNQTCTAPACNAQARHCDLDHTIPYPDGSTDECNLNPKCRRHHRTKQAPGWKVAQPTPGTATWTTPAGRTHTTLPTTYDL
jgi:hypothetical protein